VYGDRLDINHAITMRILKVSLLVLLFLKTALVAHAEVPNALHKFDNLKLPAASEYESIDYWDSLILGLIEGITEYLPISSTGHLIITNEILGLNSDTPISETKTLKDAAFAYAIIIQAGAILAVIFLYRNTLFEILMGFLGKNQKGRKLGIHLIVAFLPAAIIGLSLNDLIEHHLGDNILAIALALFIGGLVMLFTERKQKKSLPRNASNDLSDLNCKKALLIGFAQCSALWPGMSRSMATIVGGYWVGLSPNKAAEFSFLLGLITLSAASAYKVVTDGSMLIETMNIGPILLGILVAFIAAIYSIRFLVSCLTHYGLSPFAWYRFALSIFLILFLFI